MRRAPLLALGGWMLAALLLAAAVHAARYDDGEGGGWSEAGLHTGAAHEQHGTYDRDSRDSYDGGWGDEDHAGGPLDGAGSYDAPEGGPSSQYDGHADDCCRPTVNQTLTFNMVIANSVANTNINAGTVVVVQESQPARLAAGVGGNVSAAASCAPQGSQQDMHQVGGSCRLRCQNARDYKKVAQRSATWANGRADEGVATSCRYVATSALSGACEVRAVALCSAPAGGGGGGAAGSPPAGQPGALGAVGAGSYLSQALDALDAADDAPLV